MKGKVVETLNSIFTICKTHVNSIYHFEITSLKTKITKEKSRTGGRPLCTQILYGQGCRLSTILGIRKLETLCYPMVKTASLCVPSFWHNTGMWRTDGRTDLP